MPNGPHKPVPSPLAATRISGSNVPMARKILFTGFPGFLGAQLLPRVLERSPGTTALCLVQKKFEQAARARATELIAAQPSLEDRIELVTMIGDTMRDASSAGGPWNSARFPTPRRALLWTSHPLERVASLGQDGRYGPVAPNRFDASTEPTFKELS